MGKRRRIVRKTLKETCEGKTVYYGKKAAETAASRARKRSGHDNILPFKCLTKSHYHIGHDNRGKRALADSDNSQVSASPEDGSAVHPFVASSTASVQQVGELAASLWSSIVTTEEAIP